MSKFKSIIAAVFVAALSVVGYNYLQGDNTLAAETRECGDNAIMRCGAMTAAELKTKYDANDRGTKGIFTHYNISATDVANAGSAKTGYVHPNGTVTVDGKVVATDAYTVGRSASLGGTKVNAGGTIVYEGADRLKSSLSAFVFFNADGSFKSAVLKVCGNPVRATPKKVVKPVYLCDTLKAEKISRTEYKFTTAATAKDGAVIKGYTYTFGDGRTAKGTNTINHTYAKPGTYTASVSVQVEVNGKIENVTGNCKVTVVVADEKIKVCDTTTNTVVTINKEDFDSKKHTEDLTKCEKMKVCDTETKKIVTIHKHEMKDNYTTELTKCDTEVCRISDKTVVTISDEEYQKNKDKYTTDMDKCKETPVPIPTEPVIELPKTGLGEMLGGGLGAGTLTLAGYYYWISRRGM